MKKNLTSVVLFSAAIAVTVLYTGNALATPAVGFVGTTVALGRFGNVDILNSLVTPDGNIWLSLQETLGLSDVYVQSNVWDPGGTTGWHTHPGASLIIVTAGTVTAYEGNDPACKPEVYQQGMGFIDAGGNHVHIIRNEGAVEARTMTVQLIPADATRRIDADAPGNCSF